MYIMGIYFGFPFQVLLADNRKLILSSFLLNKIIIIDDAFFNRNWAGTCWGRWTGPRLILDRSTGCASSGLGYDCCCADRKVPNAARLCKNKKEGGSARASPVALQCLSQFLSERKERLIRLLRIDVPFTDGVDLYL